MLHFKPSKHAVNKTIVFAELQIGDIFSLQQDPFIPCVKKNSHKYMEEETHQEKELFHDDTQVFVKK